MSALVATIGFDVDHIVYAFRIRDYVEITLLIPENPDVRTENAIEALRRILSGRKIEVLRVPYMNFVNAVHAIQQRLRTLLKEYREVVLSLSGGLRLLVIEAFIAYLTLSKTERERVRVIVVTENTRDIVYIDIDELGRDVELSASESRVLEFIRSRGEVTATTIVNELKLSKTTVYKVLKKLIDLGLVERATRGVYRAKQWGL